MGIIEELNSAFSEKSSLRNQRSAAYDALLATRSFDWEWASVSEISEIMEPGTGIPAASLRTKLLELMEIQFVEQKSVSTREIDKYRVSDKGRSWLRENSDINQAIVSTRKTGKEEFDVRNSSKSEGSIFEGKGDSGRAVVLISASVLAELDAFREVVRSSNELSSEFPEHRESLLAFVNKTCRELEELIAMAPLEGGVDISSNHQEIRNWTNDCWGELQSELRKYTSAESIAKCAVPAAVILGLGALGALVGGPVGFGAGSLAGQLMIGHAKPKELAEKIDQALNIEE